MGSRRVRLEGATSPNDTPASYPGNVPADLDKDLIEAIRLSWSAETTADGEWSRDRPSKGQCAVTALVVQDHLGGELLRATVGPVSHYWNRLPDGTIVDLTRDQFPSFSPVGVESRTREYVLSYPATAERYRVFAEEVRRHLMLEHVGAVVQA
jgi:hypothetical protein